MSPMTTQERWLAAIAMRPVDRLPFWPKLNEPYGRAQRAPFRGMELERLHEWIGSDRHEWLPDCLREVRARTSVETTRDGDILRTVFRASRAELALVLRFDDASGSWHPIEFPVRAREDIEVMTDVVRDARIEVDREALEAARREAQRLGQGAVTATAIGESPMMQWIEWLAGVQNAHYLLADHAQAVEELFEAMHAVLAARAAALCDCSPADLLYLIENTSTTLLSPDQFRRHCAPRLQEYARLTRAAGRPLVLHMCGHLKALLPDLARVGADAFEAFTSPTVGNTSLLDGRSACPGTCLIGGTNAALWTGTAGALIARLRADLDELPHHRGLVVTSAGVMPPRCAPETIKEVCEWVRQYPLRA